MDWVGGGMRWMFFFGGGVLVGRVDGLSRWVRWVG